MNRSEAETARRRKMARDVVREYLLSARGGNADISPQPLLAKYSHLMPELEEELIKVQRIRRAGQPDQRETGDMPSPPPASDSQSKPRIQAQPVRRVGRAVPVSIEGYEMVRELHRGGQGVVYLAVQRSTKRRVAIKVMREGPFSSPRDKARYEREVQILGQLKHPHIVGIHDSGESGGYSYYVMDYISGQTLDGWMSGAERTIEEALRLFADICEAINAAHLRGVIHRDLKPSNILIDLKGAPRILDFGLAKIATQEVTGESRMEPITITGQFVGSLPWASPEQVVGNPELIDTRTDVYALGVILYQMLTGRFPYDVVGSMRHIMDHIANTAPSRPASIRAQINDELETIVLKALAKEPERRYQSAGEVARDVRHYLAGEPLEAKRASTWYILKKSIQRHKIALTVVMAFAVLVAGSTIAMSVMYSRARREAQQNRQLAACLEQLLQFDPVDAADGEVSMIAHLDSHAELIATQLEEQPEVQARFMQAVLSAYRNCAAHDRELMFARRVLELRENVLGRDDRAVALARADVAVALTGAGRYDDAERDYDEAVQILRRVASGADEALADLLMEYGDFLFFFKVDRERGLDFRKEGLKIFQTVYPGGHTRLAKALFGSGGLAHDAGDHDSAESYYRRALEMQRRLDPDSPDVAHDVLWLGLLYKDMGRYGDAEALIREALESYTKLAGHERRLARAYLGLAQLHADAGVFAEAESVCREALGRYMRIFGPRHKLTAIAQTLLGRILVNLQRYTEAAEILQQAFETRSQTEPDYWETPKTQSILGAALVGLGRFDEAEQHLLDSYEKIRDNRPSGHRRTLEALKRIIFLYEQWGKTDEAAKWRARLAASKQLQDATDPDKQP